MSSKSQSRDKFTLIIISVISAIIIWAAIAFGTDTEIDKTIQISSLQIRYLNEETLADKGLALVLPEKAEQYSLKVRGSRNEIVKAMDSITIDVDLSDVTEAGEQEVEWSISGKPSAVSIQDSFDTVSVTIDTLTTKEVDVNVRSEIDSGGMYIVSTPRRESVSISGAASELEQVDHIEIFIDTAMITQDISRDYPITFVDSEGEELNNLHTPSLLSAQGVRIDNKLEVESIMYNKKSVAVTASLDASDTDKYTLETNTVGDNAVKHITVGVTSSTRAVETLASYPSEGTNIEAGEQDLEMAIEVPDGVYVPEEERTYTLSAKIYITRVLTVDVNTNNIGDGLASYGDSTVRITVNTLDEDLSSDDVTAEADMSDLGAGSYTIDLTFTTPDGTEVVGDYTCEVTLYEG